MHEPGPDSISRLPNTHLGLPAPAKHPTNQIKYGTNSYNQTTSYPVLNDTPFN